MSARDLFTLTYICWAVSLCLSTCSSVLPAAPENVTIDIVTVGFINNAVGASYASQGPPIDASVEELQQSHPNITIRFTHLVDNSLTNCLSLNENVERMLAKWYYGRTHRFDMTVIMNAACLEGNLINRLAAAWNCLYIATGGYDHRVSQNKLLSPSLIVATSIPFGGYADAYRHLLQRYKWTSIYIMVDDDSVPAYTLLANTVDTTLLENANIKSTIRHHNKLRQSNDLRGHLKEFTLVSRVMLFFGNAVLFRKLLVIAARLNMTNGDYVYITIEPLPNYLPYGNLSPVYGDEDDNITLNAYQSVLVLEPADPDALMPQSILERFPEFESRSVRDYNVTYKLPPKGWAAITYSYLGALLFGKVLDEALLGGSVLSDGAAFARRFAQRTFDTRIGSFYINANGITQISLAVSYFNFSTSARVTFFTLQAGSSSLDEISERSWNGPFGKGIPLNEPVCGYSIVRGSCGVEQNTSQSLTWSLSFVAAVAIIISSITLQRYGRYHDTWWSLSEEQLTQART